MGATATLRTLRGLILGCLCALVPAAPAAAQANGAGELEAVPTNGLQLVSGEFVQGKLMAEFWRPGTDPEKEPSEGIVLLRADRTKLFLPFRYLSKRQNYLIYRSQLYPPNGPHPVFRPPNYQPRELEPDWLWTLADDALMANMWVEAKQHFDDYFKLALEKQGQEQVDRAKPFLDQRLKTLGIKVSTVDGRWVDDEKWHVEQGLVRHGKVWVTPEKKAELIRIEREKAQRTLDVQDPHTYSRVHLDLVRSFPGEWTQRGAAKVHFFARYHDQLGDKFTKVGKFGPADYVKLRVVHDDCNHVYVSKKNKKMMDRLADFKQGTPMVLYGKLEVFSGIVIFECEDLALR
ncbi:MAG: hypothetical protein ACYTGX_02630 [Planctomycetota bacterium]|jgi:hypothetical protein